MKLSFADPDHGWLPITFTLDGVETLVDASYVGPPDPARALAEAAVGVLSCPALPTRVDFDTEPDEYSLQSAPTDDGRVLVTLLTNARPPASTRALVPVVSASLSPRAFALGIWRGLRAAEDSLRAAEGTVHWPWPFPADTMARLRELLDGARA